MLRGAAFCGAAWLLIASPAAADDRDARRSARSLGEQGLQLFEEGKLAEAYAALEKAEALYHAPTLVLYMASCRHGQGRLVEARALYEKVVADPLPRGAPPEFKAAKDRAAKELAQLSTRIPTLKATLSGAGAERAQVTVDGRPATAAELTAGLPLDPGEHVVIAQLDGRSRQRTVKLAAGEAQAVTLALPAPDRSPIGPAAIAFGAGGVFLLVGAATGIAALVEASAARDGCTPPDALGFRHCPPGNEPAASAAQALTAVSATGFALAGAGVVAGTTLILARPRSAGGSAPLNAPRSQPTARTTGRGVWIDAGPGAVFVRGRF